MRFKTWHYVVIGLLAVGFTGGILLNRWLRPYDLKTERTAARAAGLPLTVAEFHRVKPPPAEDAMPDWIALAKDLETRPLEFPTGTTHRPTDADIREARGILRDNAALVARIHQAAAKPHAYFEHEFTPQEMLGYLGPMRSVAKALGWESEVLARDGKEAEAVRVCELTLNLGDQVSEDPTMIGMLVSLAISNIGLQSTADLLRTTGPNAPVAAMVEQALRRHPPKASVAYVLQGETVYLVNFMQIMQMSAGNPLAAVHALSGGSGPAPPAPTGGIKAAASPLVRHFFVDPSEATSLHWMVRQVEAARQPDAVRLAAIQRVANDFNRAARSKSPAYLLASTTISLHPNAELNIVRNRSRYAVTLAAAQMMAYRSATGNWPVSLADLKPEPPADPFGGKPLGYRQEGKGFVVYSVGESGAFAAKPGQPEKGEYLFRYP